MTAATSPSSRRLVARQPEGARAQCDVSSVMPCLNEEEAVASCIAKARRWLAAAGKDGEVIVVDNGSTDRSVERAEAAGARVVHEPARGYGYALLRGIAESGGNVIVMGDCDDTYDFEDLTALVEPLSDGYDISIGNRYSGGIASGAMTWSHRYIGTPVLSWLLRVFAGVRHGDSQCGLRAFTREAADAMQLRTGGMEFASEMLLKASRLNLRVAEVPITYSVRIGDAKLRTVSDGWRHLRFLLLATPTWLYSIPGLLLSILGIATLAWTLFDPPLDWQPVFAGPIFLAVGVNALALGLVSRLYTDAAGLTNEDAMSRLYRRFLSFEKLAVFGFLAAVGGLAIDLVLFWLGEVRGTLLVDREALAAIAQTGIIIGVNLILVGALGGLLHPAE